MPASTSYCCDQIKIRIPGAKRAGKWEVPSKRLPQDFAAALRVTFGTSLILSGAHPRVAQELMRHSDVRLTMKFYTDASKLPLAEAMAALPWNNGRVAEATGGA
jgi:integrase